MPLHYITSVRTSSPLGGAVRRAGLGLLLGVALMASGACGGGGTGVAAGSGGGDSVAVAAESPRTFGPVPDFALTDQRGRTVTRADLLGRPWVMAAIFTRCTGPCPSISARMAELQRQLEGTDARLVSISVDPEYDSPEVLSRYAESWGADPERWLFLTGSEEDVHALVRTGFWMAVDRAAEGEVPAGQAVTHDTRLVAVDARGERRGWYRQEVPAEVGGLIARMRFLTSERAPD